MKCRPLHVWDYRGTGYYYLELSKTCIQLCWSECGYNYGNKIQRKCGKKDCKYEIEIVFDEMVIQWTGLTNSCAQNMHRSILYPSMQMQYYKGWLNRFLPSICSIKLIFQRI